MSEEAITTGVEETEVAEPLEEETGVEEQETAEPVSEETVETKTEEDAAWARMRREAESARAEAEAAQRELAELKAMQEARAKAESRLTGQEDARIAALAEATGMSEDEIIAEIEAAEESARKDLRIQELEERITTIEAEKLMQADLAELRKIDPTIKSLEDLGDGYIEYIAGGLSPEKAYWAIKAEEQAKKATPPVEVGKVATGTAEHELTDAEIDAMSPEQQRKNWKKIMAKWDRDAQR